MFNIKTKKVLSVVLLTLFVVSLTASAASASYVYSKPFSTVSGGPTVKFCAYLSGTTAPRQISFYDQSTGGYWKYWSFGDGAGLSSRSADVYHIYSKPGTYRVTLKETNFVGSKSCFAELYITLN